MGDRTSVCLTVLKPHEERVTQIANREGIDHHTFDSTFVHLHFYEVNYGELNFLPQLQEAGIAYESSWDDGDDFGKGTEYCRYDANGKIHVFTVYDDAKNPDIDELIKLIEKQNPQKLIDFILKHKSDTTPISWDDQIDFGKLYQTKRLIGVT